MSPHRFILFGRPTSIAHLEQIQIAPFDTVLSVHLLEPIEVPFSIINAAILRYLTVVAVMHQHTISYISMRSSLKIVQRFRHIALGIVDAAYLLSAEQLNHPVVPNLYRLRPEAAAGQCTPPLAQP